MLLLLSAAAAEAATRVSVRGGGFGHGIGMSQYGAKGFAEHGYTYEQILAHYYQGTVFADAGERSVRVLLQDGRGSVSFSGAASAGGRELDPGHTYKAVRSGSGVRLEGVGKADGPLEVRAPDGEALRLAGTAINGLRDGRYRDELELHPVGRGLMAVNEVSLEDYVKGVVAGEMPASWHPEALKSQAVTARTYALATNRGRGLFDQYPDTRSQVYRGAAGELGPSNAAVDATRGRVLMSGGEFATTFYFSTSGGRTEHVENVFYSSPSRLYLRSVDDPYDGGSPRHRWRFSFTPAQLQARFSGLVKGSFRRVEVIQRGASPRIVMARIVGSRGSTKVRGSDLKSRLGLFDTWAYFRSLSTSSARRTIHLRGWLRAIAGRRVVRYPRRLVGQVSPRPRAGRIVVERHSRPGWRTLRRARTNRRGAYRIVLRRPGVYRVRTGVDLGPAVRVR
jgi:stage II sporulation protein D